MIINNTLAIAAIIGLIPLKFIEFYHNANGCPGIKQLVETKGLLPGQDAANKFLDSLSCYLYEKYRFYCNRRIGENLACKIKRIVNGSMESFADYYFDSQNLFYVEENTLHIIHPLNRNGSMDTSLFTKWMFNGRWITTEDLLLKIDEELLSVENFSLPTIFRENYEGEYKLKYSCHSYFR